MNRKPRRRFKNLGLLLDILNRYTRKYREQRDIHGDIKKYLSGGEIAFPTRMFFGVKGKRRGGRGLLVAAALTVFALCALAGAYCYYTGFFHERFRSREFGSVEIGVVVPDKYFKEPDDIYAKAVLTPGTGKATSAFRLLPPERSVLARLQSLSGRLSGGGGLSPAGGPGRLLTTGTRYLPAGDYTLDLYVENSKLRKAFTLSPREVQRLNVKTAKRETIYMPLKDPEPKSLLVTHRVVDADTGADILDETTISMDLPGARGRLDWKRALEQPKLRELLEGELRTGRRFIFRYEAPLRYPKTLRVFAERNLDTLTLDVALVKEPGRLLVTSDTAGLSILVDNRQESYMGVRGKSFVPFGQTVKGTREFSLPEGNYILTVRKDDRHVQNHQFALLAGRKTELAVSYNADGKKITILQKTAKE